MSRTTLAQVSARIDATDARLDTILSGMEALQASVQALVAANTPAKVTQAPAPKAAKAEAPKAGTRVRRCTAPTKDGDRCKVMSRGKVCGLHRAAEAPAPKAKAPKAKTTKAAKAPAPTKGSKAVAHGSGLSRSEWNKALTTKARFAGGGTYKAVIAAWADVQQARTSGQTPDEVLARFTA